MTTYVLRDGKLVPKNQAAPLNPSHGQGPAIHPDFAEPVQNMADGKRYGSKRHYHDAVRAHGCRVIGNDFNNQPMSNPKYQSKGLRDDIKRAAGESG